MNLNKVMEHAAAEIARAMMTLSPPLRVAQGGERIRADGYVWCHTHGGVHDDTTDPYNYGEPDCDRADHRPVYYRARKGDLL